MTSCDPGMTLPCTEDDASVCFFVASYLFVFAVDALLEPYVPLSLLSFAVVVVVLCFCLLLLV